MAEVISSEYTEEGTSIYAWVDEKTKNKFSMFKK
jgi:hypothetical protein